MIDSTKCGVEGCTDVCIRTSAQTSTHQQHEDQQLPQHFKRKIFSADVLNVKNPCHASIIIDSDTSIKVYIILGDLERSLKSFVMPN